MTHPDAIAPTLAPLSPQGHDGVRAERPEEQAIGLRSQRESEAEGLGVRTSAIPWLGEIPAHWQVKRLKRTVLLCQNGIWGDEPTGDDKDIACIRVADFDRVRGTVSGSDFTVRSIPVEQRTLRLLKRGDLLIEKSGGGEQQPVGAVVLYDSDTPAVCSNFVARMPIAENCDSPFLRYLHMALYSIRLNTRSVKQNTGIQNLDSDAYLCEVAGIPPLAEQRIIAAYLDRETARLDALVAAKERLIALLREKRAALISRAVTRGLDPAAPMKDSGVPWLGAIPAHWEVKRCKSLFHEMDDRTETGQEMLLSLRMNEGLIPHSQVSDTPVTNEQLIGYKRTKPGDVVMNRMRAASGLFAATKTLGIVSPDYAILRPATNISPDYFAYLFKISVMQSVFRIYSKGLGTGEAGFLRLYTEQFGTISVPVPPPGEQRIIADYLDQETAKLDALVATIRRHIEKVKEYRAALIAAAVTGKIDVRELGDVEHG